MFIYKSSIGLISINHDKVANIFQLSINNNHFGTYPSASAAVDDVYRHATGCYEWDKLKGKTNPPADLYGWERIS